MSLDPGAIDNNTGDFINPDCMAKDIFDAMNQLMPLPQSQLPPDTLHEIQKTQRLLAIAISTGIIEYLKAHDSDFKITVNPPGLYTATLIIS